jgi:endonuclease/exonuclease/phosphatase family metal-dependent hydrolase
LNLGGGQSLCVFGVHLTSSPYQPYRVRDGCYERKEELLIEARQTRERELLGVLAEIHPLIKGGEKVILCGDFNEPSHLDWTRACADLHFGLEMAWPCSCEVASIGMQDAYRKLFPDPHSHPGHTWTPVPGKGAGGSDTAEHEVHDRIDFVYGSGAGLVPIETVVIGEHHDHADIVVSPFPSDHRGVKVIYEIGQTED